MVSWGELEQANPELAQAGKDLFYQHGVGLAFLATTRRDGGPRVHPMCPILIDGLLTALIVPSPKLHDLLRDGRYAMHSFPAPDNEDAFYVTGRATEIDDPDLRERVDEQFIAEREMKSPPPGLEEERLFEFDIATCLHTVTTGHGDPSPQHFVHIFGDSDGP